MRPALGVALLVLLACGSSEAVYRDFRVVSGNVSAMLDALLNKTRYDKRVRPHFGGPPVKITANMVVKSMGSVSDTDETFTMDIYFRQMWQDPRLAFSLPGRDELSLSWLFMGLFWKPDTYFMNGKRSHLHRMTVPNTFFRLSKDGFITYSMRLTVQASCPMHLRKFPLDSQKCPLLISSYGYKRSDLMYNWSSTYIEENVSIAPNLEIAQFDLASVQTTDPSIVHRGESGKDEYSMIKALFHLKRHTGFFMLQMYVPCVLIVCCSWVSFWIDPQDAPGRVMLGVMNALSLTTLGVGGKAQMPKVSYPTAIDWFVILCNCFVFAVMVEYASINLSDKVTKDLKKLILDRLGSKATPPKGVQGAESQEQMRSVSMVELPVPGSSGEEHAQRSSSVQELLEPGQYGRIRQPEDTEQEAQVVSPIIKVSAEQQDKPLPPLPAAAIPSITVTGGDNGQEQVDDGGEDHDEGISLEEDGAPREGGPPDTLRVLSRRTRRSVRRSLMRPVRAWRSYRFLPREEDVTRQLESHEEPPKFSALDINSRKVFPISFLLFQTIYWVAYLFYLSDDFPVKQATHNK